MMAEVEKIVGIAVGEDVCDACVMDADGDVEEAFRYPNTRDAAGVFVDTLLSRYGRCSAVCGPTSKTWIKTYEAFEGRGVPIILANPRLPRRGADGADPERLADRLRTGAVRALYVPAPETRRIMDVLKQRTGLVRERYRHLNRQRRILEKYDFGEPPGDGAAYGGERQAYLEGVKLDAGDAILMAQCVRMVGRLNEEIGMLEGMVAGDAWRSKYARLIMSMPGFDPYGALLVALSIGDIRRFQGPKQLSAFMGLAPRASRGGDGAKKNTGGALRWVMIQAAREAGRSGGRLGDMYRSRAERQPDPVARAHVANKMGKGIYHMLLRDEIYRHVDMPSYERKLAELEAIAKRA